MCVYVCMYCCCSVTKLYLTLCDPMVGSTPGFPVLHCLLAFAQTHVHWVSAAIQSSCPLSSPSPPAFNLSRIRIFSNEKALCIQWQKYWSFSFSISSSNEYSGLIFFRMDWLDLFAVQKTLNSLLQHPVQRHQYFGVQLSLWSNSHIHTWPLEKP